MRAQHLNTREGELQAIYDAIPPYWYLVNEQERSEVPPITSTDVLYCIILILLILLLF